MWIDRQIASLASGCEMKNIGPYRMFYYKYKSNVNMYCGKCIINYYKLSIKIFRTSVTTQVVFKFYLNGIFRNIFGLNTGQDRSYKYHQLCYLLIQVRFVYYFCKYMYMNIITILR